MPMTGAGGQREHGKGGDCGVNCIGPSFIFINERTVAGVGVVLLFVGFSRCDTLGSSLSSSGLCLPVISSNNGRRSEYY